MTDQELKEFLASSVAAQNEGFEKLRAAQRETDQQFKETDQLLKETDQLLKETIREARQRSEEADRRGKEVDRRLDELGKQIGGLGRKFGGLTEGMAWPSMKKLLQERFGMEFVVPRVVITRHGQSIELDVFGYSNSAANQAVLVEVKSRLDETGIEQMERTMERFDEFLPEHRDKQRFGIMAAVDYSSEMAAKVRERGFYLARIQDELFVLDSPESFRPRYFGNTSPR